MRRVHYWHNADVLCRVYARHPLDVNVDLDGVTCRRCLHIARAREERPMLLFFGTHVGLVHATDERAAREKWFVEFAAMHGGRSVSFDFEEVRVRPMRLDDVSWLAPYADTGDRAAAEFHKAIERLRARETAAVA